MRLDFRCGVIALALLYTPYSFPKAQAAVAQNQSSGLLVAVSTISVNGRIVTIQFSIKNVSPQRKYFYAIAGSDGSAALSSGDIMSVYQASGIKTCGNNFDLCIGKYNAMELKDYNNLTYVEPGDLTTATINYITSYASVDKRNTISLSLILAVRTGSANSSTEAVESPPGPLQVARFNFSKLNLNN